MNFVISYNIVFNDGSRLDDKLIKVKNKNHSMTAQVDLEQYLKRKYPNFSRLEIIKCSEDKISDMFNQWFGSNIF